MPLSDLGHTLGTLTSVFESGAGEGNRTLVSVLLGDFLVFHCYLFFFLAGAL